MRCSGSARFEHGGRGPRDRREGRTAAAGGPGGAGGGDAARAIGVSVDTLRRWDRTGRVRTTRDQRNRRRIPQSEVERLTAHPARHAVGDRLSARNRFPGVVRSVEVDGVMALVEIDAGPYRVTAAITRDAVEDLGLTEGMAATATVKSTSVMI